MKFHVEKATDGKHKWVGVFEGETTRRIPFGAVGYQDFTQHGDRLRRQAYLTRHRARENWNSPMSAGSLSRHLLWGDSTSLQRNISAFKRRFSLE